MSDAEDLDFELITSARQLAPAPALRQEAVTLEDWPTTSGKKPRLLEWELSAGEHADFVESGRVYKGGVFQRYENRGEDIRFLAYTTRDQHGNRIWPTIEAAKATLEPLGRGTLLLLINAANRVNNEKPASAEGNSEETQSDS